MAVPTRSILLILLIGSTLVPEGEAVVLEAVGFSASGVVKGSVAAAWHSSIGNVAAGSTFAALQSAGTCAALLNPVTGGAAVVAGLYYWFS